MHIDFLRDAFRSHREHDAIIWCDRTHSYGWLLDAIDTWRDRLRGGPLAPGAVVSIEGDFSPNAVALLLALVEHGCTVVPLTDSVAAQKARFRELAQVEGIIHVHRDDTADITPTATVVTHPILLRLKQMQHPGLILFSSGSTGESKAAVHDFLPLLAKFTVHRAALRSLTFLLFDHIGGINTMLHTLSNGGCIITVQERSPDAVCAAIARHRAELLPTSPTFINLLLLSEAHARHDLSSLRVVSYGTEVMPESTLQRFHALFPQVRLLQTYGLSEVGILRSQSESSDSLWVRIGGEGYQTRVVDGLLEIKAEAAMLGYLNAPSPFTEDGWFRTGDVVEVKGEYLRILGRQSEIINVGGEKVYPAEVENVVQLMDGVEDVAVTGEPNPITGHIVTARVRLNTEETVAAFRQRLHRFCADKLPRFKIPQKVVLVTDGLHGGRFKKMRRTA